MFGIRTVVLGLDLLTLTGPAQDRARTQAVLIHATDTAMAAFGGKGMMTITVPVQTGFAKSAACGDDGVVGIVGNAFVENREIACR